DWSSDVCSSDLYGAGYTHAPRLVRIRLSETGGVSSIQGSRHQLGTITPLDGKLNGLQEENRHCRRHLSNRRALCPPVAEGQSCTADSAWKKHVAPGAYRPGPSCTQSGLQYSDRTSRIPRRARHQQDGSADLQHRPCRYRIDSAWLPARPGCVPDATASLQTGTGNQCHFSRSLRRSIRPSDG